MLKKLHRQGRTGHSGNAMLAFTISHTKCLKRAFWILMYGLSQEPFYSIPPLSIDDGSKLFFNNFFENYTEHSSCKQLLMVFISYFTLLIFVNSRLPLFVLLVEYALDNPFADWKSQRKIVITVSRIMSSGHCGVRAHFKRFKNV
jgi:hypothetical protein